MCDLLPSCKCSALWETASVRPLARLAAAGEQCQLMLKGLTRHSQASRCNKAVNVTSIYYSVHNLLSIVYISSSETAATLNEHLNIRPDFSPVCRSRFRSVSRTQTQLPCEFLATAECSWPPASRGVAFAVEPAVETRRSGALRLTVVLRRCA